LRLSFVTNAVYEMAEGIHRGELNLKSDNLFGLYYILEDLKEHFKETKAAYYQEWKELQKAANQ